jgi:hypothetical protein
VFAQAASRKRNHSLDDVKLFFTLGNALMDASIALVRGETWIRYQELNVVTPPFPEYTSGHSTFGAAGARVLSMFTGSDGFGASVTVKAGASRIEPRTPSQPGTPAKDVTLEWSTYSAASDGWDAWFKARSYIDPLSPGPI